MKLIDLSHPLNNQTPVYPGDHPTTLTPYKTLENDHYASYLLQSCLHTGTHVDAPMHLVEDSRPISQFPLEQFAGEGVLLDVRGQAVITMRPDYKQRVAPGSIVLLYTGWDTHCHSPAYFSGHPVVGQDLAAFLVARRVKMLGFDMPSPDFAPHTLHKDLLRGGVLLLENLTNLQALAGLPAFQVFALPLRIGAEASFVRAVGVVD